MVSMKPEYTKTNDLVLHVVVATDSRDRAVELVRHMEKSNHFRQAQIVAETVVANTSDQSCRARRNIQFDIAGGLCSDRSRYRRECRGHGSEGTRAGTACSAGEQSGGSNPGSGAECRQRARAESADESRL